MGRKPNPLVLEYFTRGPKLEDASNRYQHTCKSCGEVFPKGRIDSLFGHLTKKCQSLSLQDRRKIVLRLNHLDTPGDFEPQATSNTEHARRNGNLPAAQFDTLRLNVLAEASRQVGATQTDSDGIIVDPALQIDEFFNGPEYYTTRTSGGFRDHTSTTLAPDFTRSTDLSSIAASASDMMMPVDADLDLGADQISANDYNTLNQYILNTNQNNSVPHSSFTWPGVTQTSAQGDLVETQASQEPPTQTQIQTHPETVEQRAASFPRPIAINPNTSQAGMGLLADFDTMSRQSQKPKVRGRFEPERRKQVQGVRKSGACIRCRILKKSCSIETPCSTCRSVEGPRLWKEPCIRARLADEFTLYTACLYSILAYRDVSRVKTLVRLDKSPSDLEISLFDETDTKMTFGALRGHEGGDLSDGFTEPRHVLLIDRDLDVIPKKLEVYMKTITAILIGQESSQFIKATLNLAADLSTTKEDMLLAKTLELWTATYVLTDLHLDWKIFASTHAAGSGSSRKPIDQTTSHYSYALICGQLKGAVEKRAGHLSKAIMTELERRFIKRQQDNQFETFLISIILLNCVERICWLFQTWDNEQSAVRWPLEGRPETYTRQGEVIADVLHMLLRVRYLIPKTVVQPDGVLKAVDNESASKWFDEINITPAFLSERLNGTFDGRDSRSLDGRFFARVLA